jgi:hypothetical protein
MTELLYQKQRSGRPRIINPETLDKLEKELQEPEGFNSYKEIHQWFNTPDSFQRGMRSQYSREVKKVSAI